MRNRLLKNILMNWGERMEEQYVVLELGREKYALRIQNVCEIIKLQKVINSKSFFDGVINIKGRFIPVISSKKRFNLENGDKFTRIVVVNSEEERIGIVVDRVHQVTRFSEIQESAETFSAKGLISILKTEQALHG